MEILEKDEPKRGNFIFIGQESGHWKPIHSLFFLCIIYSRKKFKINSLRLESRETVCIVILVHKLKQWKSKIDSTNVQ